MSKNLKKLSRESDSTGEISIADSFLWMTIVPYGLAIMGSVGFGIFAMFVALSVTGRL